MHELYAKCMENGAASRLTATEISAAYGAPFSLYCRYHADPAKKDPPDPFLQALSVKGMEHEGVVREADHPEMVQVQFDTPEEGFLHALRSMSGGTTALSNPPIFYLPEGMYGYPDLLERRSGVSLWGDYHYVVREIKVATNIRTEHLLQAAFYTLMLGFIQARTPDYFLITDGNEETTEHSYAECAGQLQESIEAARRIRGGWMPPAIYGTGKAPWANYCNAVAIQNDDVSLIPGIGASKRNGMTENGFCTVHDVASSSIQMLQGVRGVGKKTATNYLNSARAISGGQCVRKDGKIDLPEHSTEIFLDLEGLNAVFDDTLTDYLIGILVRKDGKESYRAFIAERKREDVMLKSFLDFMGGQEDYAMYHWHHYEKTHLRKMMERHGMEEYRLLEPDVMIDLSPMATNAFAFPTYKNSIKDIAKWLGFEWRHGDVGATSAIALYLNYADDPESNKDEMRLVMDYNEDDCIATRVVKDWLVEQSWKE